MNLPLMSVRVAAHYTGWRTRYQIARGVASLPVVFNLASPGTRRRLLRVCLEPGLAGMTKARMYAELVPGGPTTTAVQLREAWSVSEQLISKLLRQEELRAIRKARRGGPGGSKSAILGRASVIRFLKRRRVKSSRPANPSNLPQDVFRGLDVAGSASGAPPFYCSKLQGVLKRPQTVRCTPQFTGGGR